MEIIFVRSRYRLPAVSPEIRTVIARWISILSLPEIKIIGIRSVRICQCFLKPFMLVGAVIDNQIHNQIHISLFGLRKQFVEFLHRSEFFSDCIIVRNIIALIHKRGLIDWRKPDNVNSQLL